MRIAFSFLTNNDSDENGNFIFETFDRITKSHLEHTFISIFDKSYQGSFIFSKNVIPVVINY